MMQRFVSNFCVCFQKTAGAANAEASSSKLIEDDNVIREVYLFSA